MKAFLTALVAGFIAASAAVLSGGEDAGECRYVTLADVPEAQKGAAAKAVSFVINSVSRRSRIVAAEKVGKDLLRLRLEDYGIKAKDYDALAGIPADKPLPASALIERCLTPGRYYALLGVKDRDSFLALGGVDEKAAAKLGLLQIGVVGAGNSAVAIGARRVARMACPTGYYYESREMRSPPYRWEDAHDSAESMIALPNGLIAFAAWQKDGKLAFQLDPEIAADPTAGEEDATIHVPFSCMKCHAEGVTPFECRIRKSIGKGSLVAKDRKEEVKFRERYAREMPFASDRQAYALALKAATGLTGKKNAEALSALMARTRKKREGK